MFGHGCGNGPPVYECSSVLTDAHGRRDGDPGLTLTGPDGMAGGAVEPFGNPTGQRAGARRRRKSDYLLQQVPVMRSRRPWRRRTVFRAIPRSPMSTSSIIVLAVIVVVILWAITAYNGLVTIRQRVNEAFADID